MAMPDLWGLKRLVSRSWPGAMVAAGTHTPADLIVDLKDYLPNETLSQLWLRVFGTIAVATAGGGTATGRENPEALIRSITARSSPAFGVFNKSSLSARGSVLMGIFDKGYAVRVADVTDAAPGLGASEIFIPLVYKQPGSINPIEWSLPMSKFSSYQLTINAGGRNELFTGGTTTWNLTGLTVELWADYDRGVAGEFHLVEEFERTFPITASQTDFEVRLDEGYLYTHLLFFTERDDALVNDIINNIHVVSGARVWTPQGEANDAMIQRWNRELYVNNAAEVLTGVYFIPGLRDGSYRRAFDAGDQKVQVKLDVTFGAGTQRVTLRGRRIVPFGLKVAA